MNVVKYSQFHNSIEPCSVIALPVLMELCAINYTILTFTDAVLCVGLCSSKNDRVHPQRIGRGRQRV